MSDNEHPEHKSPQFKDCSTFDHIWRAGKWTDRVEDGQKCLCGKRRWRDDIMMGLKHKKR